MALFCFSAGPAFLLGVVGGLAGSTAAGWLLLGVQVIAVVVTGVTVCRVKAPPRTVPACRAEVPHGEGFSSVIVSSVSRSASAMLQVCLYVIVFSALSALLDTVGISAIAESLLTAAGLGKNTAEAVVPVLMEVTGGCVRALGAGLPMMAFAVGFGGFSVQLQVLSITRSLGVNTGLFMVVRLYQGVLSALLTAAALELLPDSAVVSAGASVGSARLSGSAQGAVMLVVMCAMCVLCLGDGADSTAGKKI